MYTRITNIFSPSSRREPLKVDHDEAPKSDVMGWGKLEAPLNLEQSTSHQNSFSPSSDEPSQPTTPKHASSLRGIVIGEPPLLKQLDKFYETDEVRDNLITLLGSTYPATTTVEEMIRDLSKRVTNFEKEVAIIPTSPLKTPFGNRATNLESFLNKVGELSSPRKSPPVKSSSPKYPTDIDDPFESEDHKTPKTSSTARELSPVKRAPKRRARVDEEEDDYETDEEEIPKPVNTPKRRRRDTSTIASDAAPGMFDINCRLICRGFTERTLKIELDGNEIYSWEPHHIG